MVLTSSGCVVGLLRAGSVATRRLLLITVPVDGLVLDGRVVELVACRATLRSCLLIALMKRVGACGRSTCANTREPCFGRIVVLLLLLVLWG